MSPPPRTVISPRVGWEPVEPAPAPGSLVSAIVDIRTLQSLRIVVPPAIPTAPPVQTASAFDAVPPLPTFDELLHGPIGPVAARRSPAGLALLLRRAARIRTGGRRRATPSAGGGRRATPSAGGR